MPTFGRGLTRMAELIFHAVASLLPLDKALPDAECKLLQPRRAGAAARSKRCLCLVTPEVLFLGLPGMQNHKATDGAKTAPVVLPAPPRQPELPRITIRDFSRRV